MLLLTVLVFILSGSPAAVDRMETEHFIYYLTVPKLKPTVDSALASARLQLSAMLKDTLGYRPEIHVVDNQPEFDSLIGGKFPDWGAAAAVPTRRMIVIKSPMHFNINRSLTELLAHEYSHLALADRTGFYAPPRWFDEGLAMTVSKEWSWSDNLAMSKAAVFRGLLALDTIEFVNRFSEGPAHVAYATSLLAVSYLYKQYGSEAVNLMLDSIARGVSVDAALLAATGSNYSDFEAEFRVYLNGRFNAASLLADTMYFWLALAFVLILAGYLQWRRRRAYYKKWEKEDRYESKDFDYGDSDKPETPDVDEFDDTGDDDEYDDDNDDDNEPWRK
jgi:hypothetical protein